VQIRRDACTHFIKSPHPLSNTPFNLGLEKKLRDVRRIFRRTPFNSSAASIFVRHMEELP
jgi:hypothetical protein